MKNWARRICSTVLAAALAGIMAGCGSENHSVDSGQQETVTENLPLSGIMVPVAEFTEVKFDLNNLYAYALAGENLYYSEFKWLDDIKEREMTLYRAAADGTGVPELVAKEDPGNTFIDAFYVDKAQALYLFGRERTGDGDRFYLSKHDAEGREIYHKYQEDIPLGSTFILEGFADGSGNSVLLDKEKGTAYLFNHEGEYTGSGPTALAMGHLLDTGGQGVFLMDVSPYTGEIMRQKMDFVNGTLGEPELLTLPDEIMPGQYTNIKLLSGYERGLLVSTENTLWQYNQDTKEAVEVLSWQSGTVNIDGTLVAQLDAGKTLEDGKCEWKALLVSHYKQEPELVTITYADQAAIPQKKQVVAGVAYPVNFSALIKKFNRSNQEYQVILKEYSEEELAQALMFGRGEVPDVLDTKWISTELLVSKGLLADLTPYFKDSGVVDQTDILEPVLEAGIEEGKLVNAVISYSINSLVTTAEEIPDNGWDYEDFFKLEAAHPESRLLYAYNPNSVFSLIASTMMDGFIDWEKGECSFDSPEFIKLLERVNGLNYPENQEQIASSYTLDDDIRRLLDGEFLIRHDFYMSPYSYQVNMEKYGEKARVVGYPSQNGEPCYLINPSEQLAIYNESGNKEGAWAFIEFLLSEEEQSWYGGDHRGFPVRRDAFEAYLQKPYLQNGNMAGENVSDVHREAIRYMVEHMHSDQDDRTEVGMIVYEELGALFAGDKSAEETAELIQSRMQLFLKE